ncbi:hypothetical protein [Candidatus Poriferisodalis sp.]|uniref:hypothetical protein n=1 Tax=Candidatus Poriferisodalis sp. TaxID=3101277 RepID=UPI003B014BEE
MSLLTELLESYGDTLNDLNHPTYSQWQAEHPEQDSTDFILSSRDFAVQESYSVAGSEADDETLEEVERQIREYLEGN